LLVALACVGFSVAEAASGDACGMVDPPKEAVRKTTVVGGAIEIWYPDPRTVPSNYTGCLNTWYTYEGTGPATLVSVAKFNKGVTESVRVPPYGLTCEYRNNALVPDPARLGTCLEAADVTLDKWRRP
jgi:hypothetical protein